MKKIIATCFLLSLAPIALSGCSAVGVAAAGAATTGIAAAQEGGLKRAWDDGKIQLAINELWLRYDTDMFRKLDLTVNQGRVLITGVVQNPEHRVEAVRLAWQPGGVKQVINEIRVTESEGFTGYLRDTWASTRLRTSITLDGDIQSVNYNIDTVQGIVYLMGVAQSRAELNKVIETARTIPDVKQVVSYVKLAGEQDQTFDPATYQPPAETPTATQPTNAQPVKETVDFNAPIPLQRYSDETVDSAPAPSDQDIQVEQVEWN